MDPSQDPGTAAYTTTLSMAVAAGSRTSNHAGKVALLLSQIRSLLVWFQDQFSNFPLITLDGELLAPESMGCVAEPEAAAGAPA